ncbi:hypothetical protein PR003_g1591 [Phytophthora rubi]|uniref:Uncharacterized protein n=1 Tax=Phytophthora rubi TaxID=129364 RepID=A0A6A3NZU0_9STRA|nr:hypothetical protein PR002_g1449 [Phytophthora rubi]KAE9052194.1 hypothetical protein PR001_g730 [Phytophthora rubi]KAE9357847.1 hypothetical protein PR003_g1591 [Phytophthora rubi]
MTDWKAAYAKAAALQEDGEAATAASSAKQQQQQTAEDGVLAFVDLLLAQEGGEWWIKLQRQAKRAAKQSDGQEAETLQKEDKMQLKGLRTRLAAVGRELLLELPELNASVGSKDASKVRVLQLQLVCRMLCYGTLTKKKKEQRKIVKKEIRGLLDRVALLLDAANPPSLADEDADERSPFQEFLQQQLAPRLQMLLPELVQYLLRAYELEEEEEAKDDQDKDATNAMLPPLMPVVKPPQPPVELPTSAATGKGSILSALRQERPAKRALPAATGLFKEVQLPQQLQRQQSQPRKSRRVSRSHSSASKRRSDKTSSNDKSGQDSLLLAAANVKSTHKPKALDFAGTAAIEKARLLSSARKPGDSDMLRRAAITSSTKGPAGPKTPLLHRAMSERSHFIGRQAGAQPSLHQHRVVL